jgi:glycerol uptake facilitator-like aquaporin
MLNENVAAAKTKIAQTVKPYILLYEFFGTALMVYAFAFGNYTRSVAYLLGYILAYHITGAEFNPAISIAAFFVLRQWSKAKQLVFTLIA